MKKEQFLTYRKFNDQAAAADLALLFQENDLAFLLEDDSANFDVTFAFNEVNKEFNVKLKSEDFKTADKIVRENSLKAIEEVEDDYYLFQFSNDELTDVVRKADEWNTLDVLLAEKILQERGIAIRPNEIEEFKAVRMQELAQPLAIKPIWIIIFYIMAVLGGELAFFIGWYIAYQKKTLPNGSREFKYTSENRDHGIMVMMVGGIVFLLIMASKIYRASAAPY